LGGTVLFTGQRVDQTIKGISQPSGAQGTFELSYAGESPPPSAASAGDGSSDSPEAARPIEGEEVSLKSGTGFPIFGFRHNRSQQRLSDWNGSFASSGNSCIRFDLRVGKTDLRNTAGSTEDPNARCRGGSRSDQQHSQRRKKSREGQSGTPNPVSTQHTTVPHFHVPLRSGIRNRKARGTSPYRQRLSRLADRREPGETDCRS
jgi:hypothetical protein